MKFAAWRAGGPPVRDKAAPRPRGRDPGPSGRRAGQGRRSQACGGDRMPRWPASREPNLSSLGLGDPGAARPSRPLTVLSRVPADPCRPAWRGRRRGADRQPSIRSRPTWRTTDRARRSRSRRRRRRARPRSGVQVVGILPAPRRVPSARSRAARRSRSGAGQRRTSARTYRGATSPGASSSRSVQSESCRPGASCRPAGPLRGAADERGRGQVEAERSASTYLSSVCSSASARSSVAPSDRVPAGRNDRRLDVGRTGASGVAQTRGEPEQRIGRRSRSTSGRLATMRPMLDGRSNGRLSRGFGVPEQHVQQGGRSPRSRPRSRRPPRRTASGWPAGREHVQHGRHAGYLAYVVDHLVGEVERAGVEEFGRGGRVEWRLESEDAPRRLGRRADRRPKPARPPRRRSLCKT